MPYITRGLTRGETANLQSETCLHPFFTCAGDSGLGPCGHLRDWTAGYCARGHVIACIVSCRHCGGRGEKETPAGEVYCRQCLDLPWRHYGRCDGSGPPWGDYPCGAEHEMDGASLEEEVRTHACDGCGEYTPGRLTADYGLCPECEEETHECE